MLLLAENKTGYLGVHLAKPGQPKPYQAEVRRGGKNVHLGYFATAEEAALCITRTLEEAALRYARTPEGRSAVVAAAADQTPMRAKKRAFIESFFT